MSDPQYGLRSPDGQHWWDGSQWQPVVAPSQPPGSPPGHSARNIVIGIAGLIVLGGFITALASGNKNKPSTHDATPVVAELPTPSPAPKAGDPTVQIASDKATQTFTITATNPGPGVCHHLRIEAGGATDPRDNPTLDVKAGAIIGKVYDYQDVAEGVTVTIRLSVKEARSLPENPAADSYDPNTGVVQVGAAGYCEDSRSS